MPYVFILFTHASHRMKYKIQNEKKVSGSERKINIRKIKRMGIIRKQNKLLERKPEKWKDAYMFIHSKIKTEKQRELSDIKLKNTMHKGGRSKTQKKEIGVEDKKRDEVRTEEKSKNRWDQVRHDGRKGDQDKGTKLP